MNDTQTSPTQTTAEPNEVLVALNIDCRLTAAQLAALTSDQSKQLFEAIKTVATITRIAAKTEAK